MSPASAAAAVAVALALLLLLLLEQCSLFLVGANLGMVLATPLSTALTRLVSSNHPLCVCCVLDFHLPLSYVGGGEMWGKALCLQLLMDSTLI